MKTQQIEDKILTQLLAADPEKTIRLHAAEFTPTQIDRCCLHWPELMLVWATDLLDDEQFAYCCLRVPRTALDEFSRRLGPELFDSCVEACPEAALSRVLERLTDRQFDRSVHDYPQGALSNPDVMLRLTRQQFAYCVQICPAEALEWAPGLLTYEQLKYCLQICPADALEFAMEYLSPAQLRYCCTRVPWTALTIAGHKIPTTLIAYCCQHYPMLTLRSIDWRLTQEQRRDCIYIAQWSLLEYEPELLEFNELVALVADYRLDVRELIKLNPWHYLVTLLEACLGDLDNETASVVRSAIELQKNEEEPEA